MQSKVRSNILDFRVLLCLFLVWCIILCPLGEIHQKAQAIAGIDDALIAIVVAGLAAVGITFVSTGAYASLEEYVGSLLGDYATSRGLTPAGLFTGVQSGANNIGKLLLNNRFVQLIEGFAAYLQSRFNLANNSTVTAQAAGSSLAGYTAYQLPIAIRRTNANQGYELTVYESTAPTVGIVVNDGGYIHVVCVSSQAATISQRYWNGSTESSSTFELTLTADFVTSTLYHKMNGTGFPVKTTNVSGYDVYTWNEIKAALNSANEIESANVGIDINVGTVALPSDDPDYDEGDGAIVDVSAPWGMTYPDLLKRWIPGLWSPGMTGEPAMTYESEGTVQSEVDTGPETVSVSDDPGDYAVPGLQSVFPFCIPFDIYNLLSALAADPVAPSFTWRFYVPGICDENITVDLSPFDTVAQIVRTVELLAFIVGLALVTRERFLRG